MGRKNLLGSYVYYILFMPIILEIDIDFGFLNSHFFITLKYSH